MFKVMSSPGPFNGRRSRKTATKDMSQRPAQPTAQQPPNLSSDRGRSGPPQEEKARADPTRKMSITNSLRRFPSFLKSNDPKVQEKESIRPSAYPDKNETPTIPKTSSLVTTESSPRSSEASISPVPDEDKTNDRAYGKAQISRPSLKRLSSFVKLNSGKETETAARSAAAGGTAMTQLLSKDTTTPRSSEGDMSNVTEYTPPSPQLKMTISSSSQSHVTRSSKATAATTPTTGSAASEYQETTSPRHSDRNISPMTDGQFSRGSNPRESSSDQLSQQLQQQQQPHQEAGGVDRTTGRNQLQKPSFKRFSSFMKLSSDADDVTGSSSAETQDTQENNDVSEGPPRTSSSSSIAQTGRATLVRASLKRLSSFARTSGKDDETAAVTPLADDDSVHVSQDGEEKSTGRVALTRQSLQRLSSFVRRNSSVEDDLRMDTSGDGGEEEPSLASRIPLPRESLKKFNSFMTTTIGQKPDGAKSSSDKTPPVAKPQVAKPQIAKKEIVEELRPSEYPDKNLHADSHSLTTPHMTTTVAAAAEQPAPIVLPKLTSAALKAASTAPMPAILSPSALAERETLKAELEAAKAAELEAAKAAELEAAKAAELEAAKAAELEAAKVAELEAAKAAELEAAKAAELEAAKAAELEGAKDAEQLRASGRSLGKSEVSSRDNSSEQPKASGQTKIVPAEAKAPTEEAADVSKMERSRKKTGPSTGAPTAGLGILNRNSSIKAFIRRSLPKISRSGSTSNVREVEAVASKQTAKVPATEPEESEVNESLAVPTAESAPEDTEAVENAQVVEDEAEIFGEKEDDDQSFVSESAELDEVPAPADRMMEVDTLEEVPYEEDFEDDEEDDEDYDEDEWDDDEGRTLTAEEESRMRQEKEDAEVERLINKMTKGPGHRSASASVQRTPDRSRNTNIDTSKVLEISTIESRIERHGSKLTDLYRERQSNRSRGSTPVKRTSSFNPKASSMARILAKGIDGDFDETTIMFGGAEEMLDYIEDSEKDEMSYEDPVKRSMKFAACRALIGDLLSESNVYDASRIAAEDED
eukprot:CAMPEP_0184751620 /NCGR_PEP_ID=MMETSP0315-20130426/43142_1 /TAXON_ID=101924 /ORGANISM="Rhodosorus marinus, Strain UTEX LB 2760" /LENGTH=1044 /DNA_ID=CAMNT_0027230895 /DNA_START=224 /DNA_END=3358 /DNA_ORIENTATION=-